jgi:hypothetical protein
VSHVCGEVIELLDEGEGGQASLVQGADLMGNFDSALKSKLRLVNFFQASQSDSMRDQGISQKALLATLFQYRDSATRNRLRLFVFALSNKDLGASLVNLSGPRLIPYNVCQSSGLAEVFVGFFSSANFK